MTNQPAQARKVFQVDSFTERRFAGNPAGVVLNAEGMSARQMQELARELNNSETAFVLPPEGVDHDVRVRFFTPTTEVPICGHATIAAHYVRAVMNELSDCTVRQLSGAGVLPVRIDRLGSDYLITMTQAAPTFDSPIEESVLKKLLEAFGIGGGDLLPNCPVQYVSTGHGKMIIGLRTRDCLNGLAPNLQKLAALGKVLGCSGYFLFTLDSSDAEILTYARMFAPQIGVAEDPVTGNGNGPLGAYLVRNRIIRHDGNLLRFRAVQGEAIGRRGLVDVQVTIEDDLPTRVEVSGRAVIVFQTELLI